MRPPLETVIELVRAAGLDLEVGIVADDDHDRAIIRRCLAQPPESRLAEMVEAVRKLEGMTRAARG